MMSLSILNRKADVETEKPSDVEETVTKSTILGS